MALPMSANFCCDFLLSLLMYAWTEPVEGTSHTHRLGASHMLRGLMLGVKNIFLVFKKLIQNIK